jgi:hypothetical protein
LSANQTIRAFQAFFQNPQVGDQVRIFVPYAVTLTDWTIYADVSGSAVVDVYNNNYASYPATTSIAGTDLPTLSSAITNQDLTLTGWGTTSVAAGTFLTLNVNSASTVTKLWVTLRGNAS